MKALILAAALISSTLHAASPVQVSEAWARELPPGVQVTAVYFKIKNDGDAPMTLTRACIPNAKCEMHETKVVGNFTTMQETKEVVIPPHETVEFKPGGLHVMVLDVKSPLKTGQKVPLTLTFKDAPETVVSAAIRR